MGQTSPEKHLCISILEFKCDSQNDILKFAGIFMYFYIRI